MLEFRMNCSDFGGYISSIEKVLILWNVSHYFCAISDNIL
jgi:hypothetical protein